MANKKTTTHRVINFHKEYWGDIIILLIINFLYAFVQNSVSTFISLQYDFGVAASQMVYYAFLVVMFTREKYTTLYGKVLFWLSLVAGGFSGYKFSLFLVEYFSNY